MSPTDPSLELRDIKPAIEIPQPAGWPPYATALLIIAALAIAALAYWLLRRRRSSAAALTPAERALAELEATRALISESAETYAMAISDVLRRYIERHFRIAAVRQTSEEFLENLTGLSSSGPLSDLQRDTLRNFLARCDLVKFARGALDHPQREQLHQAALTFIQETSTSRDEAEAQPVPPTPQLAHQH